MVIITKFPPRKPFMSLGTEDNSQKFVDFYGIAFLVEYLYLDENPFTHIDFIYAYGIYVFVLSFFFLRFETCFPHCTCA